MYKISKDFQFNSRSRSYSLKKGEELSEADLIKKIGDEGVFKYMMSCTNMKFCVELITEEVETEEVETEEVETEEVETEEVETEEVMFMVKKDVSKSKKVILKEGETKSFSELKKLLGKSLSKAIKDKKLMEIKISKNV